MFGKMSYVIKVNGKYCSWQEPCVTLSLTDITRSQKHTKLSIRYHREVYSEGSIDKQQHCRRCSDNAKKTTWNNKHGKHQTMTNQRMITS